jgi:ferritin-like metal-binding protein YciE
MNETNATASPIPYDADGMWTLDENERHSLQTYVSDMLALERHIEQPVEQQSGMSDTQRYVDAKRIIGIAQSQAKSHIATLEGCLAELGGHEADPMKSAWAGLLGAGAKAVNAARKTKVSKALRDDYAALALASVSYEMLYTTAVATRATSVAAIAKAHLADYASTIMEIGETIPTVVLQELGDDGETVLAGSAETIRRELHEVWSAQADIARR